MVLISIIIVTTIVYHSNIFMYFMKENVVKDVFMELIEKQAAVTRLATALQNRMLKEPGSLRKRLRGLGVEGCRVYGFRV